MISISSSLIFFGLRASLSKVPTHAFSSLIPKTAFFLFGTENTKIKKIYFRSLCFLTKLLTFS